MVITTTSLVRRTLYCYAAGCLARTFRDLAEVQRIANRAAVEYGYQLGPLFVEESCSGEAIQSLMDAVAAGEGAAAVAVPHRGHLIPLGQPQVWEWLLEELTDHPLVVTSRTPDQRGGHAGAPCRPCPSRSPEG